jgi:hypothetical protein
VRRPALEDDRAHGAVGARWVLVCRDTGRHPAAWSVSRTGEVPDESAKTGTGSTDPVANQQTLNLRVRGSSPWRRTRVDLGILDRIESAQCSFWGGFRAVGARWVLGCRDLVALDPCGHPIRLTLRDNRRSEVTRVSAEIRDLPRPGYLGGAANALRMECSAPSCVSPSSGSRSSVMSVSSVGVLVDVVHAESGIWPGQRPESGWLGPRSTDCTPPSPPERPGWQEGPPYPLAAPILVAALDCPRKPIRKSMPRGMSGRSPRWPSEASFRSTR